MLERPVLKARWTDLLLLNFAVPVDVIARLAPPGTEPDLHDGAAYISIVGFRFTNVRFLGVPVPGHTRFDEINLRYYVKRVVGNETRRGVVFVREIVPRRAVAVIANHFYHENYITRRMRSSLHLAGAALAPNDTIEYTWRTKTPLPYREAGGEPGRTGQGEGSLARSRAPRWNRLNAHIAAPLELPLAGSLHEFVVEHYWGYVHGRDNQTREYRVAHEPWRVAPADNVTWDCDLHATYNTPLADFLATPPASALVADGSPVQVYRGRKV